MIQGRGGKWWNWALRRIRRTSSSSFHHLHHHLYPCDIILIIVVMVTGKKERGSCEWQSREATWKEKRTRCFNVCAWFRASLASPTFISSSTLKPGFCGCARPNCQSAILFPPRYSLDHSKEYFHVDFLRCYGPFSGAMQMWKSTELQRGGVCSFWCQRGFLSTAQTEAQRVQWNGLFTWVYAVKHVGMKNSRLCPRYSDASSGVSIASRKQVVGDFKPSLHVLSCKNCWLSLASATVLVVELA